MSYDFKNDTPIYVQIIEHIKMQIIKNVYKPFDRLPSVRELSVYYEVNPNTVQKALAELEECGLIFTERTNGKFVTGDMSVISSVTAETVKEVVDEFFTSMQNLGYSKETALNIINKKEQYERIKGIKVK